jgi:very-short-patch-repair endonuclease
LRPLMPEPAPAMSSAWAQAWAAEQQDGVIARAQALALGMTDAAIAWRLRTGRWQRLLPGVYATFSGRPDRRCQLWAVILRAGPGAVLSHRTAAELWGLITEQSDVIHVTVPRGTTVAPIPGVALHYSGRSAAACHPALSPPRTRIEETVLDLVVSAATIDDALGWVFRACAGRHTTPVGLATAMCLRRRMRWRPEVSRALGEAATGIHSLLEHRYLMSVERGHRLPPGTRQRVTQRRDSRQYSDVAYEEYGTLIELDGRAAHPESARWRDIRRDRAQVADGQVTLRYNWTEVSTTSCAVAAEIGRTLRRRGWTGALRRCGRHCRAPELSGGTAS